MNDIWDEDKITAYHEAGHLIGHWLSGKLDCVDLASIKGKYDHEVGRVQLKPFSEFDPHTNQVQELKSRNAPYLKEALDAFVITYLLGPAAEGFFIDKESEYDWYTGILDDFSEDNDKYSDFGQVFSVSIQYFGGDERLVYRYLESMAIHVRKLVENPDIWRTIQLVAERLLERKIMPGNEIVEYFREHGISLENVRDQLIEIQE